MRALVKVSLCASIFALASRVSAQVANICPATNVCFKLNIPESTASSGSGDIFFSISAPSSYEWVALGQGTGMGGSNMFVVYTASGGSNMTISPRTASGHSTPSINSNTQLTLLEGSSVSNGVMTANIRCSNCNSWSGGTMDFTSGSGNWIYAYQSSGGPKNSNDQSASIRQHNEQASFAWDFANAKGGSSVNPLISSGSGTGTGTQSCIQRNAASTGTATVSSASPVSSSSSSDDDNNDNDNDNGRGRPTQWGTAWPGATGRPQAKRQESLPYCDEVPSNGNGNSNSGFTQTGSSTGENRRMMLIAHGVLASLAFVILFPAGAMAIRLMSFPGVVWVHAAFQVFAYIVYIIAFGLGVYLATQMDLMNSYHPIIGMLVLVLIFFQPITGWLHHLMFKKYSHRTMWSYGHIWLGRAAVTLGIINGGLGLMLADSMNMSSRGGMVAYGIIGAGMWMMWVCAMVIGERRRKRQQQSSRSTKTSKSSKSQRSRRSANSRHPTDSSETSEVSPMESHYAPSRAKSGQRSRSFRSATSQPSQLYGREISEVSVD